jgi:hypothetical protein
MKLWIARILIVLLVIGIAFAAVYWEQVSTFVSSLRSDDSGADVTDNGVFEDDEFDYAVRLGSDWQVFERLYNDANANLVHEQIRELMATCGASCAAVGTVKMGDFPGTDCETAECAGMQTASYGGAALTVYVFANPAELSLDEFLAKALGKSVWADHFTDIETPDGHSAKREVITSEDGRELSNLYLADNGFIYWLNQDVIADSLEDFGDVSRALTEAVESFEIK